MTGVKFAVQKSIVDDVSTIKNGVDNQLLYSGRSTLESFKVLQRLSPEKLNCFTMPSCFTKSNHVLKCESFAHVQKLHRMWL